MQLFRKAFGGSAPLRFRQRLTGPHLVAPAARVLFSTEGLPVLPEGWQDNLWNRVVAVGDPRRSVVPLLDRWFAEGNRVEKRYLVSMVKKMRSSRRYAHALQISTWMSDRMYFNLTSSDIADRLDFINKVHGLEHAECYYNNIPKQLKEYQVYGALLNCYVEANCMEKADALFHKMEEKKMLSSFAYNMMMKMYSKRGDVAKVNDIFQEMELKNFVPDVFTYNILMEAYAASADVEGVSKVLQRIKQCKGAENWYTYAVAGKGYAKAGLINEALAVLEESKTWIRKTKGHIAYGFVVSVYADMGNKNEMHQIWNMYKASAKGTNTMYMCMISALLKLDDIEGAEAILKEWESASPYFDFRVPNLLLSAYCTRGLLEKAEELVNKAVENGRNPHANSWDKLAGLYLKCGQGLKAVEAMKKALVKGETPWKPNPTNVVTILEYLKEQKDAKGAEEIAELLQHHGLLTREIYDCLLEIYVSVGKPTTDLLDRMTKDGFGADEESLKILEEETPKNLTTETTKKKSLSRKTTKVEVDTPKNLTSETKVKKKSLRKKPMFVEEEVEEVDTPKNLTSETMVKMESLRKKPMFVEEEGTRNLTKETKNKNSLSKKTTKVTQASGTEVDHNS